MKSHRILLVLALAGALCYWPVRGTAQTSTGVITGAVMDQQGMAVPAAEVTLTHETTGVKLASRTEATGDFVFPSVLPGRYSVAVQAQGFKRFEKTGLVLTASERLSVGRLTLEVGAPSESITVTADVTPVQTQSQERSAVLNDKQMAYMSAAGRDFLNLLRLLPGVTYPDGSGANSLGSSSPPIIHGVRSDYVALSIDGVVANSRGLGTTENMLNLDAIAEVKGLMGNYQAEYGKNSGAIINAVTKSGTQVYHSTGDWYKRHEMFNANDFFNNRNGLPRGRSRYTSLGYNLGGPIYWPDKFNSGKDKLFFFFSQEIQPNKRASARTYTFPTELERKGDFSRSVESNGALIVVKDPTVAGQALP